MRTVATALCLAVVVQIAVVLQLDTLAIVAAASAIALIAGWVIVNFHDDRD